MGPYMFEPHSFGTGAMCTVEERIAKQLNNDCLDALKSLYEIGLECERCGWGLDRTLWCTNTHTITPRKLLALAPLLTSGAGGNK